MRITLDYIAGFFDGEGSVSTMCFTHRTGLQATTVSIAQSGVEGLAVLIAIRDFLLTRNIRGYVHSQKRTLPHRQMHYYRISGRASVQSFLEAMISRVSVKKLIVQDTLRFFKIYPPIRGAVTTERNIARGKGGTVALDRDQLLKDLAELGTRKAVAVKYSVNAYTITKYLDPDYRVKYDAYRRKWRAEQKAKMIAARAAVA